MDGFQKLSSAMLTPAHSCPHTSSPLMPFTISSHMACTLDHRAPASSTLDAFLSSCLHNLVLCYVADVQTSLAISILNHSSRLLKWPAAFPPSLTGQVWRHSSKWCCNGFILLELGFLAPSHLLDSSCLHTSWAVPGLPFTKWRGRHGGLCQPSLHSSSDKPLLSGTRVTILAREEPAVDTHNTLLSSLSTSLLSSCHVCLQTSKLNNCKCRHSCGLIMMTNIASWHLYTPLSTSICCFAYQSITVNQGISSSLLHPACMGAPLHACCS